MYKKLSFRWISIQQLGFILFIVATFFANTLHESYPDEFDNILGGWYILQGKLPYTGFFTHHGPIPYFIAAFITLFSGQSFVKFRILYSLLLVVSSFVIYMILKKRLGASSLGFYPFFMAFLGIEATYYWLHMLLADNIAAFAFLPAYAIVLIKGLQKKPLVLKDITVISICSAIGLYSSLTYLYLYILIHFSALYLYYRNEGLSKPFFALKNYYPLLIIVIPHVLFGFYLLITGSIKDYYYQNFVFNAKYYIYNYPRKDGSSFINPVRYAILIAHWDFINFYTLLIGVKSFDFSFPINMAMAVGNVALFFYALLRKQYKLAVFVLGMMIFTNIRSDPLKSSEKDYQAGVYNMLSFFNIFLVLTLLYRAINENIDTAKKVVYSFLLLLVGIYSFFALLQLVFKFNEKTVSKYMGDQALIYDRPKLAPVINSIVTKDEYAWVGPFEFEDLFYMNAKIPSKYHILIAGIGRSEQTSAEMLADFRRNKPVIIMFDKHFNYLGTTADLYSKFFLEYLNQDYVTLLQYRKGNTKYVSVPAIDSKEKLDLEAKTFIRKDKVDEVIRKLIANNYIREVPVK